jgi:hypothetical protein
MMAQFFISSGANHHNQFDPLFSIISELINRIITMTKTAETAAKSSFKLNVKQKNWLVSVHVASSLDLAVSQVF